MVRGIGRGVGIGVAVRAALAVSVAAPGCSRTGLDDAVASGPAMNGGPSPGSPGDDATASNGDDAAASSSSGGSGGGNLFTSDMDGQSPPSDGSPGDGQGGPAGCAATCSGCCTVSGVCHPGLSTAECGNGGEACHECEPERSCNFQGICA